MLEKWKNIQEYDNMYAISNYGNVYSNRSHRQIGGGYTQDGYNYVALYSNSHKRTNVFVHRLVAQYFIPNPNNYPIVNHKDEDKKNNIVSNLEWCDYQYNCTYNDAHKKRGDALGKVVYCYLKNNASPIIYKSAQEASRKTQISNGLINKCCNNQAPATHNLVWSYTPLSQEEVLEKFLQYDSNLAKSSSIGEYIKKTKSKAVGCYDLNGALICQYPSVRQAGRELNISEGLIGRVCRGEAKQTHGLIFRYL